MNAPIVLFTYNRPLHTKRTLNALSQNELANNSDLIVYSDAAKRMSAKPLVDEVREYLVNVTGFRSVEVRERAYNFGLARSVIEGVSEVLEDSDRIIVLEDDMITSPYFLTYMNEALDKFSNEPLVASIHAYVYPLKNSLPEAFFLPGADCWGWATWRDRWAGFNQDGQYLLDQLKERNLIRSFDFDGTYPYSQMLKDQIEGKNDSWAVRWYASTFLDEKLTLYPGRSLVHNIGNDDSGTHCADDDGFDSTLSDRPIDLSSVCVEPDWKARESFAQFFRGRASGRFLSVINRVKNLLLGEKR